MTYHGIQISKAGYNVLDLDPTDPLDIINITLTTASSAFSLLKVLAKGKVTLANSATTTIAHGLAYTPIAWVFIQDGSRLRKQDHDTAATKAHIDGTNLTIRNNKGSSRDFYYYIFHDAI